MDQAQQTEITRTVIMAAQQMLQFGCESWLAEQTTCRLGKALGLDTVDVAISANAIVMTSRYAGRCITTTRRLFDHGINMRLVCDVQRICIMAEKQLLDAKQVHCRLQRLTAKRYNRWLVLLMVAAACAAFARLGGGDLGAMVACFVGTAAGMYVRQELAHHHHNPVVVFGLTAIVSTVVTGLIAPYITEMSHRAMAASVLMLVPGFPLVNALSDFVKGHINTGVSRWTFASLLIIASSVGIVCGINLLDWLGAWLWK